MEDQIICTDRERAKSLRNNPNLNGIDYLEVIEPHTRGDIPLIIVICINPLPSAPTMQLDKNNVRIDGGVRIRNIGILWAQIYPWVDPPPDITPFEQHSLDEEIDSSQYGKVLVVRPASDGDFSTYRLVFVDPKSQDSPPPGFDIILSRMDFSFKVDCPSDFDCQAQASCPPESFQEPTIDYMAKDYESFRQIILDKLTMLIPDWRDTNAADMSVMLTELLAYLGDQLSYYQDAVATEAYLGTARKRISIRRHTRLLDYRMHDGCNARAWVVINVDPKCNGPVFVPGPKDPNPGTQLLTGGIGDSIVKQEDIETASIGATTFETMYDLTAYSARNEIQFYTWGEPKCCLPKGATNASLRNEDDDNNILDFPVFNWDKVPGEDSDKLKEFLTCTYGELTLWITPDLEVRKVDAGKAGPTPTPSQSPIPTLRQSPIPTPRQSPTSIQSPTPTPTPAPIPASSQIRISDGINLLTITPYGAIVLNGIQLDEFVIKDKLLLAHVLRTGDVLIFEEIRSPSIGTKADADPSHRQAVRLTSVTAVQDDLTGTPVLNISWDPDDALSFPLCLWQVMDPQLNQQQPVSIAHGNVVLADHGSTASNGSLLEYGYTDEKGYKTFSEFLGNVPEEGLFRPRLTYLPLTFRSGFDIKKWFSFAPTPPSASSVFRYDPRDAVPAILLIEEPHDRLWRPSVERDLLSSDQFATVFVVELDNDGTPYIRFGDGELGMEPPKSTADSAISFFAIYRIGNGKVGNMGPEAISRIVANSTFSGKGINTIRNPMAAQGGVDPEDMEDVRQFAPQAFRRQERAVTTEDYVEILRTYPGVKNAYADLRWTGSWSTVFVSVDRFGGLAVDGAFKQEIVQFLSSYRLAVYDLEVTDPLYIPLDISMKVCLASNYLWGGVEKALLDSFSNRVLPHGRKGFFHPDNFTFGDPVYLSRLIDTAMNVPGVSSVRVDRFKRLNRPEIGELAAGEIDMASSEIARLDNDKNFPENGKIIFSQEVAS